MSFQSAFPFHQGPRDSRSLTVPQRAQTVAAPIRNREVQWGLAPVSVSPVPQDPVQASIEELETEVTDVRQHLRQLHQAAYQAYGVLDTRTATAENRLDFIEDAAATELRAVNSQLSVAADEVSNLQAAVETTEHSIDSLYRRLDEFQRDLQQYTAALESRVDGVEGNLASVLQAANSAAAVASESLRDSRDVGVRHSQLAEVVNKLCGESRGFAETLAQLPSIVESLSGLQNLPSLISELQEEASALRAAGTQLEANVESLQRAAARAAPIVDVEADNEAAEFRSAVSDEGDGMVLLDNNQMQMQQRNFVPNPVGPNPVVPNPIAQPPNPQVGPRQQQPQEQQQQGEFDLQAAFDNAAINSIAHIKGVYTPQRARKDFCGYVVSKNEQRQTVTIWLNDGRAFAPIDGAQGTLMVLPDPSFIIEDLEFFNVNDLPRLNARALMNGAAQRPIAPQPRQRQPAREVEYFNVDEDGDDQHVNFNDDGWVGQALPQPQQKYAPLTQKSHPNNWSQYVADTPMNTRLNLGHYVEAVRAVASTPVQKPFDPLWLRILEDLLYAWADLKFHNVNSQELNNAIHTFLLLARTRKVADNKAAAKKLGAYLQENEIDQAILQAASDTCNICGSTGHIAANCRRGAPRYKGYRGGGGRSSGYARGGARGAFMAPFPGPIAIGGAPMGGHFAGAMPRGRF